MPDPALTRPEHTRKPRRPSASSTQWPGRPSSRFGICFALAITCLSACGSSGAPGSKGNRDAQQLHASPPLAANLAEGCTTLRDANGAGNNPRSEATRLASVAHHLEPADAPARQAALLRVYRIALTGQAQTDTALANASRSGRRGAVTRASLRRAAQQQRVTALAHMLGVRCPSPR